MQHTERFTPCRFKQSSKSFPSRLDSPIFSCITLIKAILSIEARFRSATPDSLNAYAPADDFAEASNLISCQVSPETVTPAQLCELATV